jgi:zinc protease
VLGGGSGSRLNRRIRQQEGIAYFAASALSQYADTGLWFTFSKVQADRTGQAARELAAEFRELGRGKPITAAELAEAKELLVRNAPATFNGIWGMAGEFARVWAHGSPLDRYDTFLREVQGVTLNQVNKIAREYAGAERTFFVLIGDRATIEPQLKELGIGEPVVLQ